MKRKVWRTAVSAAMLSVAGCQGTTAPDNATANPEAPPAIRWNASAASQLARAIETRAAHGLDHLPFASAGRPGTAEGDAALTRAALAYAAALARGASDPARLYDVYTVPRPAPDLRAGLALALRDRRLEAWLNGLAPQDDNYRKLSQTYQALRRSDEASDGGSDEANGGTNGGAIPHAPVPLEPGGRDPRLPAIARQLVEFGYLDERAAAAVGPVDGYVPALVAAVRRMQADYGIRPDGVIGGETLTILNLSDAERLRAMAVAMERLRWLEREPPATRIDVNLAAARLSYWRDGEVVDTRKTVVGDPATETPQIGSPIFRLVANPTWTVPRSVQKKEIAGKGAAYLRRNDMAWKNGWIVQRSGPKNALGLVKFDMQNDHAIYLHDTPAKALFDTVQRQRSHGCVRVEDATGFAELIARDEGVTGEWHEARDSGREAFVKLPRAIPVRMLYQTVLFDRAGEPVVRADPYGWDDRVANALGFSGSVRPRLKTVATDVGP